jgi:RNA polymerase sigma factor (TIGR02999 family)
MLSFMTSDVTRILSTIEQGDPSAAQLLPLVYDELRKLAAQRLAQENPGQTLQATALVHEAYLRLVDVDQAEPWNSRGHFFVAAAEAMRRILIESARRKKAEKRGGQQGRFELRAGGVAHHSRGRRRRPPDSCPWATTASIPARRWLSPL